MGKKLLFFLLVFQIIVLTSCERNEVYVENTKNTREHFYSKEEINNYYEEERTSIEKYANEINFFHFENGILKQKLWEDGNFIKEYEIKGMDELVLVTDKNLYFEAYDSKESTIKPSRVISVFRVPIEQSNSEKSVRIDQKEQIFTVELNNSSDRILEMTIYNDKVIFTTDFGNLFVFDEKMKKIEEIKIKGLRPVFANKSPACICNGIIYLMNERSGGLYSINLNEDTYENKKIDLQYIKSALFEKDKVFYSTRDTNNMKNEIGEKSAIYCIKDERKALFLKYEDIKELFSDYLYKKNGKKIYQYTELYMEIEYVFNNRIYFTVNFLFETDNLFLGNKIAMCSVAINNRKDVRIEDRLSDFFENDGEILETISDKCLLRGKNETDQFILYRYDLNDNKVKVLNQKDSEWWYYMYNYLL